VERLWPEPSSEAPLRFVGCDTEYTPTFARGAPRRRTALLQLASGTGAGGECLLAHIHLLPSLPPRLSALLLDARCIKVGVAVADDLQKLGGDFRLPPAQRSSFVDLAVVAALYGHERVGLKNLATAFGLQVAKPKAVQLSNWEAAPLSLAQVRYAALDAQLSLWLLEQLHARHGVPRGDERLEAWAAAFVGARTVGELQARARRGGGGAPITPGVAAALAEYEKRQAAAAAARARERELRTIAEGLAEANRILPSLQSLASLRGLELEIEANSAPLGLRTCIVRLGGRQLGRAVARSRASAEAGAARSALKRLQRETAAGR